MAILKKFVNALKSFFRPPGRPKKKKVSPSTSETRYRVKKSPGRVKESGFKKQKARVVKKKVNPLSRNLTSAQNKEKPARSASKTQEAVLKPALKKTAKVLREPKLVPEFYVGEITHFFPKISVVVVEVQEHPLLIGDMIHVKGSKNFSQRVSSLQVESLDVRFARRGEKVGLKVIAPARPGDKVYKNKK